MNYTLLNDRCVQAQLRERVSDHHAPDSGSGQSTVVRARTAFRRGKRLLGCRFRRRQFVVDGGRQQIGRRGRNTRKRRGIRFGGGFRGRGLVQGIVFRPGRTAIRPQVHVRGDRRRRRGRTGCPPGV